MAFPSVPFVRERQRRADAIAKGLNGIDFVDVDEDGRTLSVYFFLAAPSEIEHAHYRITGGEQIRNLRILEVRHAEGDDPKARDRLKILVDRRGDYSTYRLEIIGIGGFDPLFAAVDFTFGTAPGMALDCAAAQSPAIVAPQEPDLNYLSKDFDSFRQLALDRFALNVPSWSEPHIPDIGITLVELLAYAGDQLSYYQDAVATEAYLDTARLRISVRRHARLVDYRMHEGCNARAFVSLEIDGTTDLGPFAATDIFFTTPIATLAADSVSSAADVSAVPASETYAVFEPVYDAEIHLFGGRSTIGFYTWGDVVRQLPAGATRATLVDGWIPKTGKKHVRKLASLKAGDFLIFEEVIGPATGSADDADPAHRAVVRLVSVQFETDPLYDVPVVEIAWGVEDALAFPLILSAPAAGSTSLITDVSVARGNVVLVDHGATQTPENLGTVPAKGRFGPVLAQPGLTFRQTPSPSGSSKASLTQDPRAAAAIVSLTSDVPSQGATSWSSQYDLLESGSNDAVFVVEMDDGRNAHLRFGDGYLGQQPPAGAQFTASYRVGNGAAGNVGAESIAKMVLRSGSIEGAALTIRNPLPASGGVDPESTAQVKLLAPNAYQTELLRAITTDDYVEIAQAVPGVFQAAAEMRWTGNRAAVRVAIDPAGTEVVSADLLATVAAQLEQFRQIGYDLEVVGAFYVPLHIVLEVTVSPDYLRGHVEADLLQVFGTGTLADGSPAMFNPQNLGFGLSVYQSQLIGAAQVVTGVETVTVKRLGRLLDKRASHTAPEVLALGPLEVAQLDNDPSAPQRGTFRVKLVGGR
ncbi:MAG TPA: putative baseplate assembly protein [Candidatus Cybelea sp.]|nr:putative baseplate assembly protein [Candidatus Cybelea sp.]